ncbi:MAG TPA: EAL domain-containing protein [Rhodocyclaceae bacterium]|nr:EAL domain-containing protein [Rhodocyclaceae bacterium]
MADSKLRQVGQPELLAGNAVARILLVATLYFFSGQASFSLSVSHGIVTLVVFLAEGFALSAAIIWGRRIWPGIFLGQLLLALFNNLAWPLALGVSVINSIEAIIGATLFRRMNIRLEYDRLRDVGLLLTLIFLILQPFSATLGVLLLWSGGVIDNASLQNAWLSWWLGNSLGQTIMTPLLLTLSVSRLTLSAMGRSLLVPLLLTLAIGGLVFFGPQLGSVSIGLALSAPLMVLLAARYGMIAATLSTVVIACLTLYYTNIEIGPFAGNGSNDSNIQLFKLNFFLLSIALTGQFIAALFAERKQIEDEIKLGRERLQAAQRIANVGSWTLDLRSSQTEWSDEYFRIFNFDPAHVEASYEAFIKATHPEDRQMVIKTYSDSLENKTPYEITHRLLLPDGRIKHVLACGETLYAEDGTPLQSQGTLIDITNIRQTEEKLQLFARVFEQSGEAIVVTDHDNNIIKVNPAFTQLTGYTLDEVLGRNPRMLASGETPAETYPALWQALNDHGKWQGELWDRRKDGRTYPKWTSISVIRNAAGKVTNYIASFVDIAERKASEERIHRLAHHDPLTGLLNRLSLKMRIEQALRSAQRENRQLAVMFLDMDRFKSINDTLGHHVGDMLLVEVAERLTLSARASDIVARLGGDEFVVVLTGTADRDAAAHVAEKIVNRLGQPYVLDQHHLHSSISVGISLFPEHGSDVDTLMRHADIAMYHAKEQGCNKFNFFTPAMTATTSQRLALEGALRAALEEEQFELHYQPQTLTESNRIFRVEALARWRHAEDGLMPPSLFIPLIEKIGLTESFGAWVLNEACRQLAIWRAQGIDAVRMAVNISSSQLRSPKLLHLTMEIMSRHGIQPGELEFEVDEATIMDNPERVVEQLNALNRIGVDLAIGNYGACFSSLAYLRLLPIQTLKLSRAFVNDIETDANAAAVIAALLTLARNLNLQVVAEGVETETQRTFLASHQCDLLQGYFVSRPLPSDEATRFIGEN